jgi:hypothetical protein
LHNAQMPPFVLADAQRSQALVLARVKTVDFIIARRKKYIL